VIIVDLPEQIAAARRNVAASAHAHRIAYHAMDLLDPAAALPDRADAVWMSQLLDCFAEDQVVRVLEKAAVSLAPGGSIFVLELLCDRQKYDAAAYSLNATSLYFTCLANGVSRMYRSTDLLALIRRAGLRVQAEHDDIGVGHTLLQCVRP
jgi:hypothetical protein